MKNFEVLSSEMLKDVKGGRIVTRYDIDGDGEWDIKEIVKNNGDIRYVYR